MDFLVQVLIILSFSYFLAVLLFRRSRNAERKKYAPQAAGAWPIIGHLPLFREGPKLPHLKLADLADKYGPIFGIRLGVHPALVVSSSDISKEIFTNHDVAVSSRPDVAAFKHLSYGHSMFAFAPYGSYWREMRKTIVSELLSHHRLELLKHVRVSEVKTSLKELYRLWSDHKKSSSSNLASVEMKEWFGAVPLNVVFRKVIGKRYYGAAVDGGTTKGHDKETIRMQEVIARFFHLLGVIVLRDAVPYLGFVDLGGQERSMKNTAKELDDIANKWLREHKERRALGKVEDQDFMDVLLSILEAERKNPDLSTFDADTITKTTCLAMIVGGSDTSYTTLTWALSLLLNNRRCLKKIQEELDIHVGRERLVNDSDISKLKYLQAAVKETFRVCPPSPFTVRLCTEDFTLNGSNYHVSKGTWVFFNVWKIHTDPLVWSEPHEFKPERFLSGPQKDMDVKGVHFDLMPFGCGRRSCPGSNFALQLVNLTLASLLQAFDISTPSNEKVDMTGSVGLNNTKVTPLDVLISPRLSPQIYGCDGP